MVKLSVGLYFGVFAIITPKYCKLLFNKLFYYIVYIHLPMTKNGEARNVPLNSKAKEMLIWVNHDHHQLIPFNENTIKFTWSVIKQEADLMDLHFHDTRHEAISRFVRDYKMPVETLAKITGHRDLKVLLNTYYNPTIDEIAQWLD